MKRLLLKSIVAGTALLASVSASADKTEKFYLGVTGYTTDETTSTPITVDATVYDDYSFVVGLPASGSVVSANNAKIDVRMTDVASLGVSGTKSISKTFTTGVTGVDAKLDTWLSNAYKFAGASLPVTVIDGSKNQAFTYTIGAVSATSNGYTITGTPSSTENARAAWQMITANVTTGNNTDGDSYVAIPSGTYVQVGNEQLVFENSYNYLKGEWTLSSQMQAVKDNAYLETLSNVTGLASDVFKVYLPVGTTLALGNSYATLNKAALITMDFSANASADYTLTGLLSDLRTASDKENAVYEVMASLMSLFNEVIGMVDYSESVPVTVEFEQTEKFYLGVTGYSTDEVDTDNPITVSATVYGDYSFDVSIPKSGTVLSANNAKIDIRMTDVASLGVSGTKSISKTFTTGITGANPKLDSWLSNAYAFAGASLPVKVIDGDASQSFTYNIGAATVQSDGTYAITGTPSSTSDARAAWQMITANVKTGNNTDGDSYVAIPSGTYVQVGNEQLVFENSYNYLKGEWTLSSQMQAVKDNAYLETLSNVTGLASDVFKVYLPVGTTLALGNSYATLNKAALITMDFSANASADYTLTGLLSDLRTASDKENAVYEVMASLMSLFNEVIGMVDYSESVPVTVEFDPVLVDIYQTDGTVLENKTLDDFTTIQKTDLNAVANVISGTVSENDETTNLIADKVCANFVVTDKSPVNIPEAIGGFTATNASYSRKTSNQYGTICLPFAVSSSTDIQYYQFSSLNEDKSVMTLTEATSVDANTPAVFAVTSTGTMKITASEVTIPATVNGTVEGTLTLTGVQTDTITLEKGSSSYYIAQDKFWQPTTNAVTVYPQRAYFTSDGTTSSGVKAFTIALGDDAATAITSLQDDDLTAANIYSISGVKQSSLQKGVNIIRYANGQTRKVIVK